MMSQAGQSGGGNLAFGRMSTRKSHRYGRTGRNSLLDRRHNALGHVHGYGQSRIMCGQAARIDIQGMPRDPCAWKQRSTRNDTRNA